MYTKIIRQKVEQGIRFDNGISILEYRYAAFILDLEENLLYSENCNTDHENTCRKRLRI